MQLGPSVHLAHVAAQCSAEQNRTVLLTMQLGTGVHLAYVAAQQNMKSAIVGNRWNALKLIARAERYATNIQISICVDSALKLNIFVDIHGLSKKDVRRTLNYNDGSFFLDQCILVIYQC